jgi:hypothetical protein
MRQKEGKYLVAIIRWRYTDPKFVSMVQVVDETGKGTSGVRGEGNELQSSEKSLSVAAPSPGERHIDRQPPDRAAPGRTPFVREI